MSKPRRIPNMIKLICIAAICFTAVSCHWSSKKSDEAVSISGDASPASLSAIDTTEIDFVASSPEYARILLENEHVRVIEYSLKPGEKDNLHTHPPKTSYVISGGTLRVYPEHEEPFDSEEIKGAVEWADKRGKHYVENIGKTTVTILLTEVKSAR